MSIRMDKSWKPTFTRNPTIQSTKSARRSHHSGNSNAESRILRIFGPSTETKLRRAEGQLDDKSRRLEELQDREALLDNRLASTRNRWQAVFDKQEASKRKDMVVAALQSPEALVNNAGLFMQIWAEQSAYHDDGNNNLAMDLAAQMDALREEAEREREETKRIKAKEVDRAVAMDQMEMSLHHQFAEMQNLMDQMELKAANEMQKREEDLKTAHMTMKERTKAMVADKEIQLEELEERHQGEMARIQEILQELKAHHAQELARAEAAHMEEVRRLSLESHELMAENRRIISSSEADRKQLESAFGMRMVEYETAQKDKENQRKGSHAKERSDWNNEMNKLRAAHDTELKRVIDELGRKNSKIKAQHEEVAESWAVEQANLASQHREASTAWEEEKKTLIGEHVKQVTELKDMYENQMKSMESEHSQRMRHLESLDARELDRINVDNEHRMKELASDWQKEMDRVKIVSSQKYSDLELRFKALQHKAEREYRALQSHFIESVNNSPSTDIGFKERFEEIKEVIFKLARCKLKIAPEQIGSAFNQKGFTDSVKTEREMKLVLEQAIWNVLGHGIFSTPFKVFGSHADTLFTQWRDLFYTGEPSQMELPEPSELAEKWRYATVECLRDALKVVPGEDGKPSPLQESHAKQTAAVSAALEDVMSPIAEDFGDTQKTQLKGLVSLASQLAMELGVQPGRMQLFSIASGKPIENPLPFSVNDRNGKNGARNMNGTVMLSISPGLQRIGDFKGTSLDKDATILCPADVFLRVP